MSTRRRLNDEDAWADQHLGECAIGQIHELRESSPPGRPFEPRRASIGFLEWDGDALRSPKVKKRKRNRGN